uniref:Uncharacterized protein n=1 Tax=Nelumbo nucifera TaxID=4432 RepID=A0A822XE83_NELNU|nr:TPA_asm: hypothetical protein HUJ06_019665 [Nelumbo nucifera]
MLMQFCFLEKSTVKKCYRLGARELSIVSASEPKRWTWTSMPGSRFPEVAKLRRIRWLDMDGSIYANWLSPKTLYAAYLLLKFDEQASGLDEKPSELKIEIGNLVSTRRVYLINSVDNNSNKEEDEDGVVDPDQDFNNNEDEDSIPILKQQ